MNRLNASIAVALGLGIGAVGLVSAQAVGGWSGACTDGQTPGEQHVVDYPASVSYETNSTTPVPSGLLVCYSTSPTGSSDPEAAGGAVFVPNPLAYGYASVECRGDREPQTVVAVDCYNAVNVTDDPSYIGTSVSGTFQESFTSPVTVGRTGVEGDLPTTTLNLPTSNDGVTSASVAMHLCAWATGPGPCPVPGPLVGVTIVEGDVVTTGSASPPCTGVDNTCPSVRVDPGRDAADTVTVTVAGTTQTANLPDTGPCIQLNATC